MAAASLLGVRIVWSAAGPGGDLLSALLAGLDDDAPLADQTDPSDPSRTVRFMFRHADEAAAADPREAGWEPSFFHGIVQTFRGPKGFLIWDHASRILVPQSGSPVEAEIAPAHREVAAGTTNTALQLALILALRPAGLFHLHGAALVLASGTIALVVGGSGAGKTTTTLALLEAGADYLGDDSLFLSANNGVVRLQALSREFHVGPATLAIFPHLAEMVGPPPGHTDKRPLDPSVAYPGRRRASASFSNRDPALALFPAIAEGHPTSVVPLARAEAFGRFLGSSGAVIVEDIPGREENLATLGAVLHGVRCYEVRLGADAKDAVPRIIGAQTAPRGDAPPD